MPRGHFIMLKLKANMKEISRAPYIKKNLFRDKEFVNLVNSKFLFGTWF